MLTYVATIPLSTRSLTRLAELIRTRRAELGGRWRRLPAHEQALMSLAHLRNGDTLTRLAVGFAVSVTTAWRYPCEAIDLLATLAPNLAQAAARAAALAYAIIDGTLIPIDRVADQKPYPGMWWGGSGVLGDGQLPNAVAHPDEKRREDAREVLDRLLRTRRR